MKNGYFVFMSGDLGSDVEVYFLEYDKDSSDIFQKITDSSRPYDDIYEDWIDWVDDKIAQGNEPKRFDCDGASPWPFKDYNILGCTTLVDY